MPSGLLGPEVEPAFIIWNDVHLKPGNEEAVLKAFYYMLETAEEKGISHLIFAGDLFDSRTSQRQKVLQTLDEMLNAIYQRGFYLDWFPGNHDKTLYASYDSFLDVYKHYPNCTLHTKMTDISAGGMHVTLLPFFSDDMLIPMLEEHSGGEILISHFEMAGSTHLGKTSEKTSINQKLLSKWEKTYLGHYHNYHEISKDIVHLPSFIQASFGEDNNKGFTIIYDDLSYEIIKGEFREFNIVDINLDEKENSYVQQLIDQHKDSDNVIRFVLSGADSRVKAFDTGVFKDTGIDWKKKYEKKYEYNEKDIDLPKIIEKYDKQAIQKSFKIFCDEKGYDYLVGKEMLDNFLLEKDEQSD